MKGRKAYAAAVGVAMCGASLGAASSAEARGLKAPFTAERMVIDGLPKEWRSDWRPLAETVKGDSPGDRDLQVRASMVYDAKGIYVAADVVDDKLVGGGDRLELLLGIPGGRTHSLSFYPGVPGKSRAKVKAGSMPVRGAKIVEAPAQGGYTIEAFVPWKAIPQSKTIRVGYRGAFFFHDADKGRRAQSVVGTNGSRSYASLPPISLQTELSLGATLLQQKGLTRAPNHNSMANVVGGKLHERVLLYGSFLVVLGPGYLKGERFYYRELSSNANKNEIPEFKVVDVTGDGRKDIVMRRWVKGETGKLELFEVLSFHGGSDTPQVLLRQEITVEIEQGAIRNEVELVGRGGNAKIVVRPGTAERLDDTSGFRRTPNMEGSTPVLLPWGNVKTLTHSLRGGRLNSRTKSKD